MKTAHLALALILGVGAAAAAPVICPKYVVQAGDSLYSISQKYNVLPDELNAALQACGQATNLLQIGQEICLPGGELAGCANVKAYNGKETCKTYVTQQGDTITSVATALNIYQVDLQNLNNDVVANGILQPGKYLKLPPWSQSCGDPNKSGESCRVYVVNAGDFIAGIASAFSVSVDEILTVNPGLTVGSVLQNGQPIRIPPFPASCGAGTPTKPPTDTILKCRGYRVQQGDNIQSIAQEFKTTVAELQSVNPELSGGALIQPGVIVKLPPYDSSCDKPILVSISSSTPPGPTSQGEPNAQPQPVPVPRPPAVEVVVQAPPTNPPPVAPIVIPSPPPAPVPVPAPAPEPEVAGPAFEEDEAPLAPEAEEIQPAEPLTTPTSGTISTRVAVAAVVAAVLAFVPL